MHATPLLIPHSVQSSLSPLPPPPLSFSFSLSRNSSLLIISYSLSKPLITTTSQPIYTSPLHTLFSLRPTFFLGLFSPLRGCVWFLWQIWRASDSSKLYLTFRQSPPLPFRFMSSSLHFSFQPTHLSLFTYSSLLSLICTRHPYLVSTSLVPLSILLSEAVQYSHPHWCLFSLYHSLACYPYPGSIMKTLR